MNVHKRQRRQSATLARQRTLLQQLLRAERDRLDLELRQRTAMLTELARHLQSAREDERQRLARDLHDELGSLLTSAKLDAARIRSRLAGGTPEALQQALERLAHLVGTLDSVIALKRRIIEDLRPSALANLGLVVALEILAREVAEQSGIEVHCALAPVALSPAAELVAYRIVQEAINNILKHARAHRVWLGLRRHADHIEVTVRDDGIGFDPGAPPGRSLGLVGMRFRVESEQGTLALHSAPGEGTSICVQLPPSGTAGA